MSNAPIKAGRLSDLIMADFPKEPYWIGPYILPKGCKMILGGGAGIGKSWISLSMARALALGETPFGCPHFKVDKPARVLLFEHELKPFGLQGRVKQVFKDVDLDLIKDTFWYVSGEPSIQFSSPEGQETISRLVNEIKPDVLFLDPIGKMHYFDENDNGAISKLFFMMDCLLKQGEDWGMSLVFTHHFGKPSTDPNVRRSQDPLDAYSFRGASKWKDDPDVRVTFNVNKYLPTPHKAWTLHSRWVTRQGEQLNDMEFAFNEEADGLVRYRKDLPAPGQGPGIRIAPLPDPGACAPPPVPDTTVTPITDRGLIRF